MNLIKHWHERQRERNWGVQRGAEGWDGRSPPGITNTHSWQRYTFTLIYHISCILCGSQSWTGLCSMFIYCMKMLIIFKVKDVELRSSGLEWIWWDVFEFDPRGHVCFCSCLSCVLLEYQLRCFFKYSLREGNLLNSDNQELFLHSVMFWSLFFSSFIFSNTCFIYPFIYWFILFIYVL